MLWSDEEWSGGGQEARGHESKPWSQSTLERKSVSRFTSSVDTGQCESTVLHDAKQAFELTLTENPVRKSTSISFARALIETSCGNNY